MNAGKLIHPLLAKTLTIGLLTLLLLIPLSQVGGLIQERVQLRNQAIGKVSAGWGAEQLVGGPILTVPIETVTADGERTVRTVNTYRALADAARLTGELRPQLRHVGIYSVPVYTLHLSIDGHFTHTALRDLLTEAAGRQVHWEQAYVFLPIADPKGIRKVSRARWGNAELTLQPGRYDVLAGISAPVDLASLRTTGAQEFSFRLEIAGSESLRLLPLARVTEAALKSTWPDPSFSGTYAPASYRIDKRGFDANWQVLELNRQFPQQWLAEAVGVEALRATGFGVDLFQAVDTYHRNERAIKYAVLFIALTFMSVFLWEVVAAIRIHPMQYLFVGLALSVFYLLLLAVSEHLTFGYGYMVSATALTVLLGVYLGGALHNRRAGTTAGAMIGAVYALLYLLILSEQYALLLGAIVLFAILAAIMLVTRRYDWHSFGSKAGAETVQPGSAARR